MNNNQMGTIGKHKGILVTFDGPNGVGKSSLINVVADLLNISGLGALITKEPTNSALGQFIRANEENYQGKILAYLVTLDRYFHLVNEISPALEDGKIVLSDRYIESSLVLQRLDGLDCEFIWDLNKHFYFPELSVLLTAPVEVLEQRLSTRDSLTRFERQRSRREELDYYLDAANYLSKRGFNMMTIDNGTEPIEKNAAIIVNKILAMADQKTKVINL
jgi:dTMP kinase